MKRFTHRITAFFLGILIVAGAHAAAINITMQPGYRLMDGADINTIISAVNNLASGSTTGTYTGTFAASDGAVGTPSFSFSSDSDTGLYRAGANSFVLVANGAAQATITTGGINGIVGATTPAAGSFTTLAASGTSALAAVTATSVTTSTYAAQSVGNALTAAGTTRADALQLAKQINNVTTAAAGTGVILPASASAGIGAIIVVFNAGANAMQVYGAGSDTIDGVAGSTGVPLTNAKRCMYILVAANTWVSAQLGVVSA